MSGFPIGVVGEPTDLTYNYVHLGAGPETLAELASGRLDFAETLKKAEHAMVLVGRARSVAPTALRSPRSRRAWPARWAP